MNIAKFLRTPILKDLRTTASVNLNCSQGKVEKSKLGEIKIVKNFLPYHNNKNEFWPPQKIIAESSPLNKHIVGEDLLKMFCKLFNV